MLHVVSFLFHNEIKAQHTLSNFSLGTKFGKLVRGNILLITFSTFATNPPEGTVQRKQ